MLSKSQIDRLGKRLATQVEDSDRRAYFELREGHRNALDEIVRHLAVTLRHPITTRLKTLDTVRQKLAREKTRLSTMQDIAGCRITVPHLPSQDDAAEQVLSLFPSSRVVDLRDGSHSGYRAVHVVLEQDDRFVEIQIRTALQDLWAQLSEAAADQIDVDLKYGGGPNGVRESLVGTSVAIRKAEELQKDVLENIPAAEASQSADSAALLRLRDQVEELTREIVVDLSDMIRLLREGEER